MCGISGIISLSGRPLDRAVSFVESMNKTLLHRGPDGSGVYDGGNYCFGHTRLSIVDLSEAGHQPMHYLDRYTITYNGEVYNYLELREELEKEGYTFDSHTDTEVIMAAYDFWGSDCVNRFNGMWAFVIHDSETGKFFISRDRFGIKPLFYTKTNNCLIFGSEIKAIHAHPEIKAEPNIEYLKRYIESGPNEYDAVTAFEHVLRFPFAHSFEGSTEDLSTAFSPKRYWTLTPNLSNERFCKVKAREYADKYYEILSDAVRLRLRADVKVGSALSGGLDSSSIVYLINQHLKAKGDVRKQETFSTIYTAKETVDCDESDFIIKIVKHLDVATNTIEPRESEILSKHKEMMWIMENPLETTGMAGWHTFRRVLQSNVTVTLDGQGADEQLAGYLHYVPQYLMPLPLALFFTESWAFRSVPGIKKQIFKAALIKLCSSLLGAGFTKFIYAKVVKRKLVIERLNEALVGSTCKGLVNLIHYADRFSMGNSIESRMPFLDYKLVEFLASVPEVYKVHKGWTKYIARLAFADKLPNEIVWRKDKMGWPSPESYWFRHDGVVGRSARKLVKRSKLCGLLGGHDLVFSGGPTDTLVLMRFFNLAVYEELFLQELD